MFTIPWLAVSKFLLSPKAQWQYLSPKAQWALLAHFGHAVAGGARYSYAQIAHFLASEQVRAVIEHLDQVSHMIEGK